jgi:hypothetical protein
MKVLLFLIAFLPTVAFAGQCKDCHAIEVKINESVIETSRKYSNVREATNNNDSPEIHIWQKNTGIGKTDPYCAAFTVSMYKDTFAEYKLKSPVPMIGGVANFAAYATKHPFDFKMISTKKMNWGIDKPEIGDFVSWKHGSSAFTGFNYKGHQGLVVAPKPNMTVDTVEGNTKAGNGGDQSGTIKGDMTYGHEGVYFRNRPLALNSNFPIMYFIRLNKRTFTL